MRAAFGLEPSPQKITPPFILSPFKRVKQHRSDRGDELCNLVVLLGVRCNAAALRRLGYYTVWISLWFRFIDSRVIYSLWIYDVLLKNPETKQRSKPKSWLERFKNDTPLRLGKILLYPSLQSRHKKRETHFDPKRDIAAAVHQSSVEPTSRWSLQNSKPMSPSTLLTFFLAFRRLPRLLTGSWNILPTWVEKDKHKGLSTAQPGSGTTGTGMFSRTSPTNGWSWKVFGHSSGRSDLSVMTLDETCRSRAPILARSIVIL